MIRRDTGFLEKVLRGTSISRYDHYIREAEIYPEYSLSSYFNEFIALHDLKASSVVEKSRLAREYAYQILNGRKRNPARDKIICLCIGARMPFDSIQRALKISHKGILYAKDRRDAAISVFVHNQVYDMDEINGFLRSKGLEPLS